MDESHLRILEEALKLDFAAVTDVQDAHDILPSGVLKIIVEELAADGGNFAVYDAFSNSLEVRERYVSKSTYNGVTLSPNEFKKRMQEIGLDSELRTYSSSYRALDSHKTIRIERSSNTNVDLCTLDVHNLRVATDNSVLSCPIIIHGIVIGVLSVDSDDYRNRTFYKLDQNFLETCCSILAPVLQSSLINEATSGINKSAFNAGNDSTIYRTLDNICNYVSTSLFCETALIYIATNESYKLKLAGLNRRSDRRDEQNYSASIPRPITTAAQPTFFKTTEHLNNHNENDCNIYWLPIPMFNSENKITGVMIISKPRFDKIEEPYLRMAQFIVNFVNLTYNTLAHFESVYRNTYEVAAHEFVRIIKEVTFSVDRLRSIFQRHVIKARNSKSDINIDISGDKIKRGFQIYDGIDGSMETASETLREILRPKRYQDYLKQLPYDYVYNKLPTLRKAKNLHENYEIQNKNSHYFILNAINSVRNRYNTEMSKRQISWELIYDRDVPGKIFGVEENFISIFSCLIENAVEYARPHTKISIEIDWNELELELVVKNVGPHIEKEAGEDVAIFERGVRGVHADRLDWKGLGIGLWEASRIAELWGGRPLFLKHSERLEADSFWASVAFELRVPYGRPLNQRWDSGG